MIIRVILLLLLSPALVWADELCDNPDGVYTSLIWTGGQKILELRDGRFRYWEWSDIDLGARNPHYPFSSTYSVSDGGLEFDQLEMGKYNWKLLRIRDIPVIGNAEDIKFCEADISHDHCLSVLVKVDYRKDLLDTGQFPVVSMAEFEDSEKRRIHNEFVRKTREKYPSYSSAVRCSK